MQEEGVDKRFSRTVYIPPKKEPHQLDPVYNHNYWSQISNHKIEKTHRQRQKN